MNPKSMGIEIALAINELDIDQKTKLLKAMIVHLDSKSKFTLENELGVVI